MASRILVVCYSRSGTAWRVAQHLAERLGADLDRITECEPRSGVLGFAQSILEAAAKGVPAIQARRDPREYSRVVLGTPVWAGAIASPVRAYLLAHGQHLNDPAFFAVMGGRGADRVIRELKFACDAPRAPSCILTQRQVERNEFQQACHAFVNTLSKEEALMAAPRITAA